MLVKIEKDIAIPDAITHMKYPLDEMDIGDSFVVDASYKPSIACAISRRHKNTSKQFTTRKSAGMIRVWRIA